MDLERIMKLARIKIEGKEKECLKKDLERIFQWMGELPEYEEKGEITDFKGIQLRDDIPKQVELSDEIIARFPKRRGRYCKV